MSPAPRASGESNLPPVPGAWLRPELVASWGEIAGVLLFFLAPFIIASAHGAAHGSRNHYIGDFISNHNLLLNGAAEAAILGLGLLYLRRRGWKPADFCIRPGLWSSLPAFGLVPLVMIANTTIVMGLFALLYFGQTGHLNVAGFAKFLAAQSPKLGGLHGIQLSWLVLVGAMVLNAYLEEIVCTSYAFNQFAARRGPLFALILVVFLRMCCHTYQGIVHVLGIGAVFLIFGLWYWRTRNVWTLILAHALLDIGSLSVVKLLAH
jgi:membrane protease YdiL (CAAX protease family)